MVCYCVYNHQQYKTPGTVILCNRSKNLIFRRHHIKGAWYLLIIHEVLVAMDFFSAGVQDETLEEESKRLAS